MRKVKIDEQLSLNVLNDEGNNPKVSSEAVIIIPYRVKSQERVAVQCLGFVPFVRVSQHGLYGVGFGVVTYNVKDNEIVYNNDVQKQADGYLSLLEFTKEEKKDPLSIVSVENPNGLPLERIIDPTLTAYKDIYMEDNWMYIVVGGEGVVQKILKEAFDGSTEHGKKRIEKDSTVTAYYGVREGLARLVASYTHPTRKVNHSIFQTSL